MSNVELFNTENEVAILSILLSHPDKIYELDHLKTFMFSSTVHQILYETLQELAKQGTIPEITLLKALLSQTGKLDQHGGVAYLEHLRSRVFNEDNLLDFEKLIVNSFKAKTLLEISSKLPGLVMSGNSIDDLIDTTRVNLDSLSESTGYEDTEHIGKILRRSFDDIVKRVENPGVSGVPIGIKDIDTNLGGIVPGEVWIIASRPSMGKEQPVYSRVYTKNGYKTIGEINVDDYVMGSDGIEHKVISVFPQGVKPVYRVYFDDNTFTDCGLNHLWLTKSRKERKNKKNYSVKTLIEIINSKVILEDGRSNHCIPINSPVQFSKRNLLLDPYVMGIILGDGNISGNFARITIADKDIIDEVGKCLPETDVLSKPNKISYRITKKENKGNHRESCRTVEVLRFYSLMGKTSDTKFIPADYLYSSVPDRISLLQGLLDSDGYLIKPNYNFIEYSTTSISLRDQIMELARSLGGKCSFTERQGRYTKNGIEIKTKRNYRIWISFNDINIKPFRCIRKQENYRFRKQYHNKFIIKIKYIGESESKCIMLDSKEQLYLTDNFIVTHNSAVMCNSSLSTAKEGNPNLIFSYEMPKNTLIDRFLSLETKIGISDIRLGLINQKQIDELSEATKIIDGLPIYIDTNFAGNIGYLSSTIRRYKRLHDIKVVYLDYIQLMAERSTNATNELGQISRELKLLANNLGIGIVIFSQLNRLLEVRPDKRPILSDLRQSGNLEEDADVAAFLYRDEYYNKESRDVGVLEFIIRKNRNGAVGTIPLMFDPTTTTIYCK